MWCFYICFLLYDFYCLFCVNIVDINMRYRYVEIYITRFLANIELVTYCDSL